MNKDLTVYTVPGCVQCRATKRALEDAGVTFTVVDLATDERAAEEVKLLGFMSAPVVVDGARHWSGFDPERIKAAAAGRLAETVSNA